MQVLAFDNRETMLVAGEVTAVVGGIQLTPEVDVPAGRIAECG